MLSHGERKNKRKGKRLGENGKKMRACVRLKNKAIKAQALS